jgi:hypothetical protein
MTEMPEGWEVPTFSCLKDEPLIFGVPHQQARTIIYIGGGLGLLLGQLWIAISLIIFPIIVMRDLHKKDQCLFDKGYPLVRWLG